MVARLLVAEVLVIRHGPRRHRCVVQPRGYASSWVFGQGLQPALGPRLDREDAFDGRVRKGRVTDGPLQRGDQILTCIRSQESQHPLRLVLAVTLCLEQALQELTGRHSQFRESFLQLGLAVPRVFGGPVLLLFAPLPDDRARQERMPGDLLDLGAVDDHLGLRHPYRQHPPDVPPRHAVAVLAVGDHALDVDRAIDHRARSHRAGPAAGSEKAALPRATAPVSSAIPAACGRRRHGPATRRWSR